MKQTLLFSCSGSGVNAILLNNLGSSAKYQGDIPLWFPCQGCSQGKYITMEIDIANGRILNWVKPTEQDLSIFIPAV